MIEVEYVHAPAPERFREMVAALEQREFDDALAELNDIAAAVFGALDYLPGEAKVPAPAAHGEHHNHTLYETGLVFTLINPWPTDRAKAMLANWRRTRTEVVA